jgi:molybdate transport repressor ModE-like protein
MMDWNDVRIFLAIARAGSLAAASKPLGLSHPTVGRRLRVLEASLGQILFQRTPGGLLLTEEGQSALHFAEQAEETMISLERRLSGSTAELQGRLTISSSDWFSSWVLPAVIREFTVNNPQVTVELLTGSRLSNLTHREADLAFRVVAFDDPDIVQRRVLSVRYAVYRARHLKFGEGSDGAGMSIIEDAQLGETPPADWLKRRLPEANIVLRSNSRTAQASACADGTGLAVLPRPIGDRIKSLVEVDLGEAPPSRDVWMGYHGDLRKLGRLRAFVELSLRHFEDIDVTQEPLL